MDRWTYGRTDPHIEMSGHIQKWGEIWCLLGSLMRKKSKQILTKWQLDATFSLGVAQAERESEKSEDKRRPDLRSANCDGSIMQNLDLRHFFSQIIHEN